MTQLASSAEISVGERFRASSFVGEWCLLLPDVWFDRQTVARLLTENGPVLLLETMPEAKDVTNCPKTVVFGYSKLSITVWKIPRLFFLTVTTFVTWCQEIITSQSQILILLPLLMSESYILKTKEMIFTFTYFFNWSSILFLAYS